LLKLGDGAHLLRGSLTEEELTTMQQQASQLTARQLLRMTRLFNAAALETKASFLPQLPLELAFVEVLAEEATPEAVTAAAAAAPKPDAAAPKPQPVVREAPMMRESPPPEPAIPSPP
jgi:DNA polymerase III gamma/tau subunit